MGEFKEDMFLVVITVLLLIAIAFVRVNFVVTAMTLVACIAVLYVFDNMWPWP